jgi:DNA-directed RNA polymerase beta subunit
MERDSIIGHGISHFLNESMMERSDAFKVQVDTKTGLISYDDKTEDKTMVNIPYCMKLLLQELESISIAPRLVTDDVKNMNRGLMSYVHQNISKNSIEEEFFDDDEDVEET